MSGFALFGVNLSGAEYNAGIQGQINFDYTYPTDAEIDYYASQGFTAIRLPFLLERVQPVMNGPLDSTQLGYIDNVVNYAASKGIDVILDPHNYGDAYGSQIGSAAVPNSAFASFWGQVAGHFASESNVLFGLMNEPNNISATQWLGSVNAAIGAIRASGATTQQILVPGTYWDTASNWVSSGNAAIIGNGVIDPDHNFAFEVHQYLDSDSSGTHTDVVSAAIGAQRLEAVTAWAEATGNKLFLGEFGVSSDAVSLEALNNMLSFMQQHSDVWEGGTYWAAGAWWGPYMYSVEPANGVDKPQLAILDQYAQATPSTGSASVVEVGSNFYLSSNSGGSTFELQYSNAYVVAGQFGALTPIAATQTATGYEVAWKVTGANEYDVWKIDSSGNYVSDTGVISGTSTELEALETSFHQDLNGDGVIGFSTTVIETGGSTSLTQVASNYYLYSGGTGPSLKQGGVAVVAGQFGAMTPIAVEQTATGYDVAWKVTGADQYTVWSTDSNGNFVSAIIGTVSGTSTALESIEPLFHQDLNGDGTIGLTGPNLSFIGAGDLTAGGGADLVWQNGGGADLWVSNGSTLTQVAVPGGSMGAEWTAYGVGDFNGDGNADLLWINTSGQAAIWEMNGPNIVGVGVSTGKMGAEWHVAGIGDFNGDGDSDILWVNTAGQAAVWTMKGTALAAAALSNGAMGAEWHVAAIGDFNNDGRSDVLWESATGSLATWEMNGANLSGFVQTWARLVPAGKLLVLDTSTAPPIARLILYGSIATPTTSKFGRCKTARSLTSSIRPDWTDSSGICRPLVTLPATATVTFCGSAIAAPPASGRFTARPLR